MTSRARRLPPDTTVRHIVVDGLRTRVEVRGDGPPLLLIMGLWGEIIAWDPLIDQLSGFTTIAFDAPGIGGTDLPSVPHSLPALAAFTVKVLDAVGVRRAHVLGVSFGGLVAQQLATSAPSRVDRVVLASTMSGVVCLPGTPHALMKLLTPWSIGVDPRDAGDIFGGRMRKEPQLMTRLGLRPPAGLSTYANRLAGLTGWWGLPWSIRQPVLVITGDDDPLVPSANSRILAACLPDSRLYVVPGGGHLVLFDSPGAVAPVISRFLRTAARPGAGTLAS